MLRTAPKLLSYPDSEPQPTSLHVLQVFGPSPVVNGGRWLAYTGMHSASSILVCWLLACQAPCSCL